MKRHLSSACVSVLVLTAACAVAQEEQTPPPPESGGQDQPAPGEMTGAGMSEADMAEAMERYMRLAAPGPHHEHLAALAGQWNVAGKFRMTPEQPWEESNSEGESELVLDGRFLHQHYVGEPMAGMPMAFEGIGYIGYDNQEQQYVSAWMDNMGTMILTGAGSCADDGKTITFRSEFFDPMMAHDTYMKSVYSIEGPDRYVLRMYGPAPDGEEFLVMELVHTRK